MTNGDSHSTAGNATGFTALIAWLTGLPLDDPAWQALPDQIATLQRLLEKHDADLAARAAAESTLRAQRTQVAGALDRLAAAPAALLTFFGLEHVAQWQADDLAAEQLATAADTVARLGAAVTEYAWLQAEGSLSLSARRTLRSQLADIEDQIEELILAAQTLFGQAPDMPAEVEPLVGEADGADEPAPAPIEAAIDNAAPATAQELDAPDAAPARGPQSVGSGAAIRAAADEPEAPVNDLADALLAPPSGADTVTVGGLQAPIDDLDNGLPAPQIDDATMAVVDSLDNALDFDGAGETLGEQPEEERDLAAIPAGIRAAVETASDQSAPASREEPVPDIEVDLPLFEPGADDGVVPDLPDTGPGGEDDSGIIEDEVAWPPSPPPVVYPDAIDTPASVWADFIFDRIGVGDLSTAYWVTRSLAEAPNPIATPFPAWQLAALQGAWWLNTVRGALVQDLMQIVYGYTLDDSPNAQALAMAAALTPALTEPETGLSTWLGLRSWLPDAFGRIVHAVGTVAAYNRPLLDVDIDAVRGEDRRAQAIAEVVREAQRWVEEEPQRRSVFKRASDVWYAWTAPEGELRQILDNVAAGESANAGRVEAMLEEWRRIGTIPLISKTERDQFRRVPDRKSRNIDGGPRDWLVTQAEDSLRLAKRWCDLVRDTHHKQDWFAGQIEDLYHVIELARDDADIELAELESAGNGVLAPMVVRCLRWALHDLCRFFQLPMGGLSFTRLGLVFPREVSQSLDAGLRYRLLLIPDTAIAASFAADSLPAQTAVALRTVAGPQPATAQAIEYHLQALDLRHVDLLCANLPSAEQDSYLQKIQAAKDMAQALLGVELSATNDAVEQAYVDGLIDIGQRAELANQIEAVRADKTLNYVGRHRTLEVIREQLLTERKSHLKHQEERWHKVQQRLQKAGLPLQDTALYEHILELMTDQLARQDVIVVDERLARLEEVLDQGQAPNPEEFVAAPQRSIYREFADILRDWEAREGRGDLLNHLRQQLKRGELPSVLRLGNLPKPRVIEVIAALDAWSNLKRARPNLDVRQVRNNVEALLRYVGFLWDDGDQKTLKLEREGGDWAYLQAPISSGNLSPVPQFGSLHGDRYDVVCLWERPEKEVIGSRLHSLRLNANNVIVIYLGRLTRKRRLQLTHYVRQQSMAMLVLDEYLLMFLAREPSRLPAFFKCALPLTAVNPYVATGPVAPEMFKGRAKELAALKFEGGYALVYGGRQLGKSALLQQVEREFHDPQVEHYVVRTEIQHVGDPLSQQADPELIWQRLKDGLEKNLLIPKTSATKPATIMEQVAQAMAERPERRVLVLFDEADSFLAADQQRNFEIVSMLRTLMDNTNRRFKVIFAGLHNVQRYVGVPNQPFAHLPNLEIGPLEPLAARRLIVEPLEALGFRFGKNQAAMLGILAYTNSHPGLIQLFCHHLLNVLYERRPRSLGPVTITRQDIETVYRRREVQDGIRGRFEWTIRLDLRYKALAEIMVVEQLEERDGFSHAYSASELRELGQMYWPQAFNATPLDEFRGYLNEMVGLGVLVRTERNEYRLRSPNLVRLMGAIDDIKASLDELTQRAPAAELVPDSHHAPLDDSARRYSPFTFAQSRSLNARRYGVGLIFGSEALGIELADDAFQNHFIPVGASGKHHEVRHAAGTGDAFNHWLKRLTDETPDTVERLIVYRTMKVPKEAMAEQVAAALDFCSRRRHSQRQWMRILLVFDTVATYEWLQLPRDVRDSLEQQADATVVLRTWNEVGVSQRLRQHNKLESARVVERIRRELGGWPWLLDRLLDKWGDSDDPVPAVERVVDSLKDESVRSQFLAACGLAVSPTVHKLFRFIASESLVPQDLLTPEIVDEQLTAEECSSGIEFLTRMGLVVESTQAGNFYLEADRVVKSLLALS